MCGGKERGKGTALVSRSSQSINPIGNVENDWKIRQGGSKVWRM